jgi:hypothetical protein
MLAFGRFFFTILVPFQGGPSADQADSCGDRRADNGAYDCRDCLIPRRFFLGCLLTGQSVKPLSKPFRDFGVSNANTSGAFRVSFFSAASPTGHWKLAESSGERTPDFELERRKPTTTGRLPPPFSAYVSISRYTTSFKQNRGRVRLTKQRRRGQVFNGIFPRGKPLESCIDGYGGSGRWFACFTPQVDEACKVSNPADSGGSGKGNQKSCSMREIRCIMLRYKCLKVC